MQSGFVWGGAGVYKWGGGHRMCAWLGTGNGGWGAGFGQGALSLGKRPHPPARLGSRGHDQKRLCQLGQRNPPSPPRLGSMEDS